MKLLPTAAVFAALFATTAPALAQTSADETRFRAAQDRFDREYRIYRDEVERYQSVRGGRGAGYAPPPGPYRQAPDYQDEGGYDPAGDYRPGDQYRERTLSNDERVYAGYDGRYYCKRQDGTTGLIVGGAAGGLLGNIIDGGRSRTVGTLLGAAGGALAGRAIDQNRQVRCR